MLNLLLARLLEIDKELFLIINQIHTPFWDKVVYWITHELFWIPLYIILLYLIIKRFKKRFWVILLTIAVLITICDQFASGLVKPYIQKLRPCFDPNLKAIVHVIGRHHGLYGFISSHAANTFGLATFLWLLFRTHYCFLLFVWASIVSYARIYGGVHYPGDILLGALSGIWWGWNIYMVYRFYCAKY
ncbi:MAG: phosphatase PAP2 family protein [Candidatus Amoebophilus sp.]